MSLRLFLASDGVFHSELWRVDTESVTTDLSDWTDSLRRTVARPGAFATFFPSTSDDDLVGSMLDGLGDAQLDGFLVVPTMYLADDNGIVTPTLTRPQIALIVLYSSRLFLRAEMANRRNRTHYAARGNSAEEEQSASVITELLKSAEARITDLRARQRLAGTASAFMMADAYLVRAIGYPSNVEIALASAVAEDIWDPGAYLGPANG